MFEKASVILLEEPRNDLFYDVLEGELDIEEYVRRLDTASPLFTKKFVEILRGLKTKRILQKQRQKSLSGG